MEHNTRDEQSKVYGIGEGHAFALVARVVVDFVLEAGFVFVFDPGALVAALMALTAAAFAAGYWERLSSGESSSGISHLLSLSLPARNLLRLRCGGSFLRRGGLLQRNLNGGQLLDWLQGPLPAGLLECCSLLGLFGYVLGSSFRNIGG